MNTHIKNALLKGRLVLLLGAGASRGCKNSINEEVPLGNELAKILAEEIGEEYCDEKLSDVYGAAKKILGSQVNTIFEKYFKHCTPSQDYIKLLKYPFFRIYTLNIDDAFENAAHRHYEKKFNVKQRCDCISEVDQFYQTLDYIKLNGDVNFPSGGFIFSPQEYGAASAKEPTWYYEVAKYFHKYTFIFIGTQLEEPLFYHQVEKYRTKIESTGLKSYVLIPKLTSITKTNLESSNIHHLEGKLSDFIEWLENAFDTPPNGNDIIAKTRPELNFENKDNSSEISLFAGVIPVNRHALSLLPKNKYKTEIREFYKGFKPNWFDITEEVPAFFINTKKFFDNYLANNKAKPLELHLILGSAGCGKSTALRQLALKISDTCDKNVYFVEENKDNFKDLVTTLDNRNEENYYLFIERIGNVALQIANIIKYSKSEKAIFVSSEHPNMWTSIGKEHLEEYVTSSIDISHIQEADVDSILDKIKRFGNWTRLERMTRKNRRIELLKKSKRQLLIGLIETTSGEGYNEIIKKDYKNIRSESQKALLILAGLATTKRVPANEATLTRALSYLDVATPNVQYLASQMEGVIKYYNGNVTTRHRIYIDRLFKLYIPPKLLFKIITAYIRAFSVYKFPIVKNVSTNEASIYKHLVNAKLLKRLLKDKILILSIYEQFEKEFENEGLFLMQYGLALRFFDKNDEAHEKLRIAHQAFPDSPHIEHALAQQRIILACQVNDETIAMDHFNEAETVLKRLNSSGVAVFDHYPIITLSEGHIKILDRFGHKKAAKIHAKTYYNSISKNPIIFKNSRGKQTISNLIKYYSTGIWPKE